MKRFYNNDKAFKNTRHPEDKFQFESKGSVSCHPEALAEGSISRHPEAPAEGSILDSSLSLRMTRKAAFTRLVKHFRSNLLMAMLRSRQSRFPWFLPLNGHATAKPLTSALWQKSASQTKFRNCVAHSYGFTLAETLIVLIALGIVGMITIPNVVKRYQEAQARTKLKRAMSVYDWFVQKTAVENEFKSAAALKQWANNDGQCTNARKLFKISEGEGCTFKTADGVYWNITDILHAIVSTKRFEPAGINLAKRKADNENDDTTFYFVTSYDPKTGAFRTNDLAYEKSLGENRDDYKRPNKLHNFINNEKPEVSVCKTGSQSYLAYDGRGWNRVEETYDSKGNVSSRKTINDGYYCEEHFDSNGNITSYESYDDSGNLTDETRYEYDENGNQTSQKYYYNGNLTGEYRYQYDGNGNQTSQKYYYNGNLSSEYRYEYDGNGNKTSEKGYNSSGNLSSEYRYQYDGNGNQTSQKYYNKYGNLNNETRYEYDGNGNQTSQKKYNSSGNLSWEARYEYDGNGNQTSYKYYNNGNGNLSYEYRYEYDENGNKTSEKYYNSSGNLSYEYRYEYDSNGNQTSEKGYNGNGNLTGEYSQSYEYDNCGRVKKYSDSDGNSYSAE